MMDYYVGHIFKVVQQFRAIRRTIGALKSGQVALHMDFSENYATKRNEEIQSAHFGHRPQVVLHQGMMYTKVIDLRVTF
jgi:hypothetical protein